MNEIDNQPNRKVAGQLPPAKRQLLNRLIIGTALISVGALIGVFLAPESPDEAKARIAALENELVNAKRKIGELQWAIKHPAVQENNDIGKLDPDIRKRHTQAAKRYAAVLRQVRAQGAADLIEWFVARWNAMLDSPNLNDRTGRRAELLSLLVGGMAANLDARDYVNWQLEFFNGNWLGDLHYDLDGDGYPGKRSMPNPRDGFANVSVCHIAMALNQTARNARVLMMPEMKCDQQEARMSIFLQGKTVNDALTELVKALKTKGFLVVERIDKGMRLILVGPRKATSRF
ncbi:MAG: hypothetical protein JW841_18100 [Deltaproteobacteria bacterium]|nr:hypothetical protein [Deltaproteobacteria bacterium]